MSVSKATGFWRPISPTEWFYLGGARLAPPLTIQLVVEGRGRIEQADVARAVAIASAACPGARLVRRNRRWVDSGHPPPVRVVDGTVIDRASFENCAALRSPLDPVKGPTCEVLLLTGEPATLVFRAFHGVMDGRGVLTWMADVFRALRGEEPRGARSNLTDYMLLSELGSVDGRPRVGLNWRSPLDRAGEGIPFEDARELVKPAPGPGFLWRRRTLEGNCSSLVTKVAAAIADVPDTEEFRFMVPVDLRRHDPAVLSTANLTLPIFLDGRSGDTAEDFRTRLVDALGEHRELSPGGERGTTRLPLPVLGPALDAVNAVASRRRRYLCSTLLSNLGRVDLAGFSAAGFEATTVYSLAVRAPFTAASIVTVQSPGRTELTLSCPDGPGMGEAAEALLGRVCDALARGCGDELFRRRSEQRLQHAEW